jgi:hypothetical protein
MRSIILLLCLSWASLADVTITHEIGQLSCVDSVALEEDVDYTTYIVVTKSIDKELMDSCLEQTQTIDDLPLLKINYTLGLIILRKIND